MPQPQPQASNPYLPLVAQYAKAAGIDPQWAQATLLTENAPGDPNAVSSAGAQGLMQILPSNADGSNLSVPAQNIQRGVAMLAANLKASGGDKSKASAMYFGGPNTALWGPKTYNYVGKVAQNYQALGSQPVAQPAQSTDPLGDLGSFLAQPDKPASPQSDGTDPLGDLGTFLAQPAPTTTPSPTRFRGGPIDYSGAVPQAVGRIAGAAAQGASDAYSGTPNLLTNQAANNLTSAGLPGQAINNVVSFPLKAAGALFGGAQGAVAQTGAELGQPQLGRDVAALPEAFMGDAAMMPKGGGNPLVADKPAAPETSVPVDQSGVPIPGEKPETPVPPPEPITPQQQAALTATSNLAKLTAGPKQGFDNTIYVPGSVPTRPEYMGDPAISVASKAHYQNDPTAQRLYAERQAANNGARVDLAQTLAGTPQAVQTLDEARGAQAEQDLATAFGDKKPVDAAPVAEAINGILTSPRGLENTQLQKYVAPLLDRLKNPDGTLKTDPEQLYGLREDIARMQSKASQAGDPNLSHVSGQLQTIKDSLDQTIEQGAPGYQQYLKNYADASKPIDTMEYLQSWLPKLVNSKNQMTLNSVHSLMKDITTKQNLPGVNAAKSIDQATLDQLWNLHSDLQRYSNVDLGRATGSETNQLAAAAQHIGMAGAHAVAGHVLPGVGNMLLEGGKNIIARGSNNKRTNLLLAPPPPTAPE
ncbi:MAG TPA: lytic transglycosylase domain-containing protein [Halothiobacillus sp.]|nr:lytic transglycosylase domain-containing protein [Halothiobacillus sp.]